MSDDSDSDLRDYGSFLRNVAYVADDHAARELSRDFANTVLLDHERFELRRRIGAGAFGVVFEAFDREFLTNVAIKVLAHARPESLWLFKQEFRSVADVVHPNLVGLFELLSFNGGWFYTMELVDGLPLLDAMMQRDHVSQADVIAWFLQLACGLQALHAADVLHRDLKPSNVLLDKRDRVVLVDFGLAKAASQEFGLRRGTQLQSGNTGAPVGTPAYLAPEVTAGASESAASDWFSFGVMLCEALLGQHPLRPAVLPRTTAPGLTPALEQLCSQLMAADPAARPNATAVVSRLAELLGERDRPHVQRAQQLASAPLIGRETEHAQLRQAHALSREDPALVLVDGQPGAGKTSLVREFLAELAETSAHAVVLHTRCFLREIVPYKALDGLMDALCQVLLALPDAERERVLPRDLAMLGRLFPVLKALETTATSLTDSAAALSSQENAASIRTRALSALKELLGKLSVRGAPIVLFIDDVQWGDKESARMLAALCERPGPPLLVIATQRSSDQHDSPCLRELETRLSEQGSLKRVRRIHVGPLPPSAAGELAARLLTREARVSEQADAQQIALEAHGNPLFIEALARHWAALPHLPRAQRPELSLDSVLGERLAALPLPARQLLELLTVAREPIEQRVLFAAAAGLGTTTAAMLKLLRWNQWLRERELVEQRGFELYHQRLAEVIEARLSPEERRERHRTLAEAFVGSACGEPERVAGHWYGAGELLHAARCLHVAADRAAAALAFERAAVLYGRVLEWIKGTAEDSEALRHLLRLERARTLAYAGRCHDAGVLYEQLRDEARAAQRMAAAGELGMHAAEQFLTGGYFDRGVRRIGEALQEVGLHYPHSSPRAVLEVIARLLPVQLIGVPEAPRWLAFARSQQPPSALQLRQIDVTRAAAKGMFDVDPLRAALFELRTLRAAQRAREPTRFARALAGVGSMLAMQGTPAATRRGDELLARARTTATHLHDPVLGAIVEFSTSCGELTRGAWLSALQGFDHALDVLQTHGRGVTWECNAARIGAIIALEALGDWPEAAQRAADWQREATNLGNVFARTTAALFAARHDLAADQVTHGHERVRSALESWALRGFHVQHIYAARFTAQAYLYEGEAQLALNELRRIWNKAQRSQQLRVQLARFDLWELRGRAAVGSALYAQGKQAHTLRREASLAAETIEREQRSDAAPTAALVRAAISHQRGDHARALEQLIAAEGGFAGASMTVHAACAQLRRAELDHSATGDQRAQRARQVLRERGVVQPDRWAALVAPGFSSRP